MRFSIQSLLLLLVFAFASISAANPTINPEDYRHMDNRYLWGMEVELTYIEAAKLVEHFDFSQIYNSDGTPSRVRIADLLNSGSANRSPTDLELASAWMKLGSSYVRPYSDAPRVLRLLTSHMDGSFLEFTHRNPQRSLTQFLKDLIEFCELVDNCEKILTPDPTVHFTTQFHYHFSRSRTLDPVGGILKRWNALTVLWRELAGNQMQFDNLEAYQHSTNIEVKGLIRQVEIERGEIRNHALTLKEELDLLSRFLELPFEDAEEEMDVLIRQTVTPEIASDLATRRPDFLGFIAHLLPSSEQTRILEVVKNKLKQRPTTRYITHSFRFYIDFPDTDLFNILQSSLDSVSNDELREIVQFIHDDTLSIEIPESALSYLATRLDIGANTLFATILKLLSNKTYAHPNATRLATSAILSGSPTLSQGSISYLAETKHQSEEISSFLSTSMNSAKGYGPSLRFLDTQEELSLNTLKQLLLKAEQMSGPDKAYLLKILEKHANSAVLQCALDLTSTAEATTRP